MQVRANQSSKNYLIFFNLIIKKTANWIFITMSGKKKPWIYLRTPMINDMKYNGVSIKVHVLSKFWLEDCFISFAKSYFRSKTILSLWCWNTARHLGYLRVMYFARSMDILPIVILLGFVLSISLMSHLLLLSFVGQK